MTRITADGFYRLQIEALNVHQRFEAALVEHIDHVSGYSSKAEAAVNTLRKHHVLQILGCCKRCAACARLEREAVLEQAGSLYHIDRSHCHGQADRITGYLCRTGDYPLGVSYGIDDHNGVNIRFGYRPIDERIVYKLIGYHNGVFCIACVRHGIAKRAAGGFSLLARAVSHHIACRCGYERYIDRGLAVRDIAWSSSVGAELYRILHAAGRNEPSELPGHIVRHQRGDDSVFNMPDKRPVRIEQRACVDRQIPYPKLRNRLHHHVQHIVAVPQMVVERNGHAVPKSGGDYCVLYCGQKLIHIIQPPNRAALPFQASGVHAPLWACLSSFRAGIQRPCPALCRFGWPQTHPLRTEYP